MTKTVEMYVDVTSPNVYLAYHALGPILHRTGATLELRPALLGGIFKATGNAAPFFTYQKVTGRLEYEQLELKRFISEHGLSKFQWTPHFPPNSVLAMRAAMVAQADGTLMHYLETALQAVWEDGKDLSDPDVFCTVMDHAGLDGQTLRDTAQTQPVKDALRKTTDSAVARGVFGMPTIFVGTDMFFGKDRLHQVEAALS